MKTPSHVQPGDELPSSLAPEDLRSIRSIRTGIRDLSRDYRRSHPFLDKHQSGIGLALLGTALAVMTGSAFAYASERLPAWLTIAMIAFACSIAHEIEHDLIHRMYFPRAPALRHLMMAVGWLMRPSTVNPWLRTHLHLAHHRISGTAEDIEERSITNGEPWNLRRFFMTGDGFLATVLRLPTSQPRAAWALLKRATFAYGPMAWFYHAALVAFLGLHLMSVASPHWAALLAPWREPVDLVAVVWVLPNTLRTFCLHFISSNIHYYGDVTAGDVLRQTQVVDRWFLLPLQLFCFNFGSTHAIHHFWVSEPFYLRQLTARRAHEILRAYGVRFNDLGTFRRANRFHDAALHTVYRDRATPIARLQSGPRTALAARSIER